MRVIYLDQNKWVELARAAKTPAEHQDLVSLLENIAAEVSDGRLLFPLTAANLYETYKINNAQRRHDIAYLQAMLSRGYVFRGRHKRLDVEISTVLRNAGGLTPFAREPRWFLSSIFIEAFADLSDPRLAGLVPEIVSQAIDRNPQPALYDYLMTAPDGERSFAVMRFSDGSEKLRLRIEDRRKLHLNEPISTRRKIYGALLLIDEADLIVSIAQKSRLPWSTISEVGGPTARRLIRDVPTYYIERELALRLEMQNRPIEENDFRDMQAFCAVVPYADLVIGENQFADVCRQARLPEKYGTQISTKIFDLREFLKTT